MRERFKCNPNMQDPGYLSVELVKIAGHLQDSASGCDNETIEAFDMVVAIILQSSVWLMLLAGVKQR